MFEVCNKLQANKAFTYFYKTSLLKLANYCAPLKGCVHLCPLAESTLNFTLNQLENRLNKLLQKQRQKTSSFLTNFKPIWRQHLPKAAATAVADRVTTRLQKLKEFSKVFHVSQRVPAARDMY